jgi:hypothetical protein
MEALNGTEHKIVVEKNDSFSIGDTSGLAEYQSGGIARQRKQSVHCTFNSLKDALSSPKFDESMHSDFSKVSSSFLSFCQAFHSDAFYLKDEFLRLASILFLIAIFCFKFDWKQHFIFY